jgi:putative ABC transport system permease protein
VPAIIRIRTEDRPTLLVKYSSGSFHAISAKIETAFKHYQTGVPYQATLFRDLTPFTDLSLPSNLVGLAFIIALFLACMGLFGLASFTSENRTKEIGIRKANGATTASVMSLLLATFTKWLFIAFFLALPVAMLLGKSFLGRFHFHAPLPVWAFIAGPLIAVIVALLTVSSQTWSVANRNPVRALRYE